jgi:hypothetical protein
MRERETFKRNVCNISKEKKSLNSDWLEVVLRRSFDVCNGKTRPGGFNSYNFSTDEDRDKTEIRPRWDRDKTEIRPR